jgi:hypothetical protein
MICLSIFRLHKIDETASQDWRIDPYLILNDSSGSSGKVTPATSCAPVSTWFVSTEARASFSSPFSVKEPIFAPETGSEVIDEKKWGRMGAERTEAVDIRVQDLI